MLEKNACFTVGITGPLFVVIIINGPISKWRGLAGASCAPTVFASPRLLALKTGTAADLSSTCTLSGTQGQSSGVAVDASPFILKLLKKKKKTPVKWLHATKNSNETHAHQEQLRGTQYC